ncbi:MAG: preprotein translocase subunit TatA [Gammaproteobacteria bacterium]|uniref:Preprotein translocase subunit TatA n=1 Tax=SAR86 cluster bacterium TaxID=2030880 RepID=A0A368BMQ6_9GAMM|nr:MAG: preprotein translocase subunit TatA [SAR86 cluster bacterium]|tara:strand:- start:2330 stop:3019 length:690 start_codon:yes stop_codon:yes gene_type:complete
MITNLYQYPELTRVEKNDVRYYQDSLSNLVPSVTTILSATGDHSGIDAWKRRVGPKTAKAVVDEATTIGTAVHLAIENYLYGKEWEQFTDDKMGMLAHQIAKRFICDCLGDIDEVWGLESGLVLDGLYAGTADCIGIFRGKPTIIDFKTAKKIKRKDWIEDYFLQGAAYANAHNVMYKTNIESIAILMVDRDLLFKEFLVNSKEFNSYTEKWKKRLIGYYKTHEILGRE